MKKKAHICMFYEKLKKQLHLRTDNFFPKEANSASLPWGETRRSLTTLVLMGSWIFSLSYGDNKLIFKPVCIKSQIKGRRITNIMITLSTTLISIQSLENFTLVIMYDPPIPESLRAIIIIWLWTSTSKNRAPSMCKSFCEDPSHIVRP